MKILAFMKRQSGSSLALVGLGLAALLAMTGVVVDVGTVYVTKTQLQKAANAAALSGAQELTHNTASVRSVALEVLSRHQEEESLKEAGITMGQRVTIRLERDVPLLFSGLFGKEQAPVEVMATAEIVAIGSAIGVAPLGIDDSVQLEFGKTYTLKVDETESSFGNFGILALGGPGANTYEQNLKYGYQSPIKIGDILETQTGNIAGKTKTGVQERLDQCPFPNDIHHRDCTRILLIPIYTPYNVHGNQIKQVKVTGFAYFYLAEPMDSHDKTIKGQFIKRTGAGLADPTAENHGAYAIRLTK